jgi:UDP-N-acetylmuramoyl-L-alanyl-D-glutamate--2,6-diaminopimelate ligase
MKKLFEDIEQRLKAAHLDWSSVGMSEYSEEVTQNDIYVARQGDSTHGIRFASDALMHGAVLVLCEDDSIARQYAHDHLQDLKESIIFVNNFEYSIKQLADRVYGEAMSKTSLIGITGTNGKTSTTFITAAMLSLQGMKTGLIGTSGYGVYGETLRSTRNTTPDYLSVRRYISELVDRGCQYVVMEVSSHAIALERVTGLRFDVKVFTNFSRDHLDFHGSLEQYREVKESFILAGDKATVVINTDDPVGFGMCDRLDDSRKVRGYGFNHPPNCLSAYARCVSSRHLQEGGQSLDIEYESSVVTFRTGLSGKFNAYNFLAAYLVCDSLGFIDGELLRKSAEKIQPIEGRAQRVPNTSSARVYVDYAHTPDGVGNVLRDLTEMDADHGSVWCLFGCGGDRDQGKRPLMGQVASESSDHVVISDDNVRSEMPERIIVDIVRGIRQKTGLVICRDREQAIDYMSKRTKKEDLVFILGKGNEACIVYGKKKLPMNDVDMASVYFN